MEAATAAVEAADDGIEVVKFSGSLCKAGFFRRGGLDDDEVFAVAADNCTGKVEPADITPAPAVATVNGGSGDAAVNDVDEAISC